MAVLALTAKKSKRCSSKCPCMCHEPGAAVLADSDHVIKGTPCPGKTQIYRWGWGL